MPASVTATAPVRVDLAGGTLDLWPLSVLLDSAITVNLALELRAGCSIETGGTSWRFEARGLAAGPELSSLPDRPERVVPAAYQLAAVVASHFRLPPARITTWSGAPPGSGLGGSSALVMALVAAAATLSGRHLEDADAVTLGCNLETRVLGLPGGSQDHWAAWCGGLSVLRYGPEGVQRQTGAGAADLARALVIADTRVAHHSGMNNWAVLRAALDGDPAVRAALAEIGDAASAMAGAVLGEGAPATRLATAREAMRREWDARRRLAPAVSSPEVEAIVAAATAAGGTAKVCGAGGGGCVACLPDDRPDGRDRLLEALRTTGAAVLDTAMSPRGVIVERSGNLGAPPESC